MSEKTSSAGAPVGAEAPPEVPARWSAARKTDVVLRLLRGAPVEVVARETQVPAHELEAWRRVFLATGTHGSKGCCGYPGFALAAIPLRSARPERRAAATSRVVQPTLRR